jgi:RNA polymerase sigma-B factor
MGSVDTAITAEERRDTAAEEALLRRWEPLARQLAGRFNRAAEREDLEQVARLALVQAARTYDPDRGCQFSTFAVRTILGAIQHYVRDRAPAVRIPRRWWDLRPRLHEEAAAFAQAAGREPTVAELAERLGASEEDVAGALEVHVLYRPMSLDDPCVRPDSTGAEPLAGSLGVIDPHLEAAEQRLVLQQALDELPRRLREILRRRFFQGQTQHEVARLMGLSQMHVSRLERQALSRLRHELRGAWVAGPGVPPDAVPASAFSFVPDVPSPGDVDLEDEAPDPSYTAWPSH